MKVIFISAPFDLVRNGYGSSSSIQYGNQPPLGILYMIGQLRREGHECQLIDAASFSYSYDEIAEFVTDFTPDLIGISSMTPGAPAAFELSTFLKQRMSIPIIMGGTHCTSFKTQVLDECPAIDYTCIGEGDDTIVEFVERMEKGQPLHDVQGICYRDETGKACMAPPRPMIMDLDKLAFPARDILDHAAYKPLPLSFKKLPMTAMITSRGCPYGKCTFCYEAGNHAFKFRRHSPEYVTREIEETIIANGIKEVLFWDDIFLIKERWVSEFCDRIEHFGLSWSCYGWPRIINEKMIKDAKRVGCWGVFFGFESGDQKLLDLIEKNMSLDDSRQAAKWAHDAGMDTRASFMLALPGETPELARKTVEFAIELDVTMVQFQPTFPEPGTVLYDHAIKEGKVVKNYMGRMTAAYVPNGYSGPEEVEKMQRWAYRRFYFRPAYWWKHLKRIKSFSDVKYYYHALLFLIGLLRSPRTPPLRLVCEKPN